MNRKSFMLIAGEPSGGLLASELVRALAEKVTDIEAIPSNAVQPFLTPASSRISSVRAAHIWRTPVSRSRWT